MEWIELVIHTTTAGSDEVSGLLLESGANGTMIEDRADIPDPAKPNGIWEIIDPELPESMPEDVLVHAWFPPDEHFQAMLDSLRLRLTELGSVCPGYGSLAVETLSVDESSWADTWKKYFKPFYASDHLVIKPTWESYTPAEGDRIIEIDPGMAFGSGTHETTAMCLSLLEENISGNEDVIDVGTGSGILAIGAALFGARSVLAVDIDPDAVKVAKENVNHNGVSDVVTVQYGDLLKQVDSVCDICVANIISDVIISFAEPLKKHIRKGGLFICSGIVSSRAEEVEQALTAAGYVILRKVCRGEWTAFLSGRN